MNDIPKYIKMGVVIIETTLVARMICTAIFGKPPKCRARTADITPHGASP